MTILWQKERLRAVVGLVTANDTPEPEGLTGERVEGIEIVRDQVS